MKARCTDPLLREEIVARMEVGRVEAMAAITSERERIVADEAQLHAEGRKLIPRGDQRYTLRHTSPSDAW
ncbi:MAG: hypothetical protein EVA89_06360 [Sandaracinaceae bacterium]|nr:MAG: hypothetical protein EVA89_06360 [Sandaracinaceae bacterium]